MGHRSRKKIWWKRKEMRLSKIEQNHKSKRLVWLIKDLAESVKTSMSAKHLLSHDKEKMLNISKLKVIANYVLRNSGHTWYYVFRKQCCWFCCCFVLFLRRSKILTKNRHQTVIQMKLKYLQAHKNFKDLPTIDIPGITAAEWKNISKGLRRWWLGS